MWIKCLQNGVYFMREAPQSHYGSWHTRHHCNAQQTCDDHYAQAATVCSMLRNPCSNAAWSPISVRTRGVGVEVRFFGGAKMERRVSCIFMEILQ